MTVREILKDIRYQLRDAGHNKDFSDDELKLYLRRALRILDTMLSSISADLVVEVGTTTQPEGEDRAPTVSGTIAVTEVWYGTKQIEPIKELRNLYYQARPTTSGLPTSWCQKGQYIMFDKVADQDYTYDIVFDQRSTIDTDDYTAELPYNDEFNDPLCQAVVMMAHNRNNYGVGEDGAIYNFFQTLLMSRYVLRRNMPNNYTLKLGY